MKGEKKKVIFIVCGRLLLGAVWVLGCSGPTRRRPRWGRDAQRMLLSWLVSTKRERGTVGSVVASTTFVFGCVWALLGEAEVPQVGQCGTRVGLGSLSPPPGTGDGARAARLGQKSHRHAAGSSGKCQAAPQFLGLGTVEQKGRISPFPSQ